MALTDRLFGRAGGLRLELAPLQAHLAKAVRRAAVPVPELIRARLADHCRDAGLSPILPEEFDSVVAGYDAEAWGRLALLVGTLELDPVREVLAKLAAARPLRELVSALAGVSRDATLLTGEVLGQSPLRVEELVRRFLAALGAAVAGEAPADSRKRLERLDYSRLLAEAEKARESAAERTERLKKMQDEQEQRRSRRGKW